MGRVMAKLAPETFKSLILPGMRRAIEDVEKGDINEYPDTPTRIGPLVSQAQPQTADGPVASSDYILKVVELDKKTFISPKKYVLRNMYLLWEVPEIIYAETLSSAMEDVASLYIRVPNPARDPENLSAEEHTEITVSPSDLVSRFRSLVSDIPAEEWTQEQLEPPVTALIKSIFAQPVTGSQNIWGFHMLRWILCALKSGPALVPSMVVLGREEVMRRFDVTEDVARRWEEKQEQERE